MQLTGCSHLLLCVIYIHVQNQATELHRPMQRKNNSGPKYFLKQAFGSISTASGTVEEWPVSSEVRRWDNCSTLLFSSSVHPMVGPYMQRYCKDWFIWGFQVFSACMGWALIHAFQRRPPIRRQKKHPHWILSNEEKTHWSRLSACVTYIFERHMRWCEEFRCLINQFCHQARLQPWRYHPPNCPMVASSNQDH